MRTQTIAMKLVIILCLSLLHYSSFSQDSTMIADLDRQIQSYLSKSKKLKTAGWITLGGGYLGIGLVSGLAATGRGQDIILISGWSAADIATNILFFKASAYKNQAKLLGIERDLALFNDEKMREKIFLDGAQYFKDRAAANRLPAIILSGIGGIVSIGLLASTQGTNDPYANIVIAGGLAYIASSMPFYIRAAQLTKTANSLKHGILPQARQYELSPVISTNGKSAQVGFRVRF